MVVASDDEDGKGRLREDFAFQNAVLKAISQDDKLSPLQVMVLQYLAIRRPGATPSEIGAEYEMSSAHTAKILRGLRDGGYVLHLSENPDARVKNYYNTLKGSGVVAAVLKRRGHDIAPKDLPHVEASRPKIRGT